MNLNSTTSKYTLRLTNKLIAQIVACDVCIWDNPWWLISLELVDFPSWVHMEACTISLRERERERERERTIEKFIPHTSCQTSPKKIKVINIKLLNFKKNRSSKNVMVVCIFDLCSSIYLIVNYWLNQRKLWHFTWNDQIKLTQQTQQGEWVKPPLFSNSSPFSWQVWGWNIGIDPI